MKLERLMKVIFCVGVCWPAGALALTSVEGAVIGDQGFYWVTPAETWVFPHRLGNIDNRLMLQPQAPAGATLYNLEAAQRSAGGGLSVELVDNLDLGLWFSTYNPGLNNLVNAGVNATDWTTFEGPVNDLQAVDQYDPNLQLGRKIDLFSSYWISDLVEAGLHLWWGSASTSLEPDEAIGPIDIDVDSDPTTTEDPSFAPGADRQVSVQKSLYALSDLGVGIGAGIGSLEALRVDFGADFNLLGVTWEPNGLQNYVDAGGSGFGLNLRAHYALAENLIVGGFARYKSLGFSLEPLKQRDGGDLPPVYNPDDPDDRGSLPDPSGTPPQADPTDPGNETSPVDGIKYEASQSELQVAALVQYLPTSRVRLYGAAGVRRTAVSAETSIGDLWFAETNVTSMSLPFFHVGVAGQVSRHFDVFMGATKHWRGLTTTTRASDERIPDNSDAEGPAGTQPPAGEQGATNANRRELETVESLNDATTQTTSLMIGTRVHYGPVQLVGHVNPDALIGDVFFWLSLIYDWDYDQDTEHGNGTLQYSPHESEPAVSSSASVPQGSVSEEPSNAEGHYGDYGSYGEPDDSGSDY